MNEFTELSIYPNPASGMVNLQFTVGSSQRVNIKVYDVNGKEITTWLNDQMTEGDHQLSFDVSSFTKGIYFISLQGQHYNETQQIMID